MLKSGPWRPAKGNRRDRRSRALCRFSAFECRAIRVEATALVAWPNHECPPNDCKNSLSIPRAFHGVQRIAHPHHSGLNHFGQHTVPSIFQIEECPRGGQLLFRLEVTCGVCILPFINPHCPPFVRSGRSCSELCLWLRFPAKFADSPGSEGRWPWPGVLTPCV